MKKIVALLLALAMGWTFSATAEGDWRVAMITDNGDVNDQSFNQTCYEACKSFCAAKGIDFTYYKPSHDSDAERIAMIEKADDDGYNVLVLPGYAFATAMVDVQNDFTDTILLASDISAEMLRGATLRSNVYCFNFKEELAGYLAGYAAVKLGYTHLGFLGGMAVPGVVRYGYGFVQGADAAAVELGVNATVEYVYGNQFYGGPDITAYMDNWYQNLGVQAVFACGGGIYTSVAEACAKVRGAKVIGVDIDQASIIDGTYGQGMTLTSATKDMPFALHTVLGEILAGHFDQYGGRADELGVLSDDPNSNFVGLAPSTQWSDTFTEADYRALLGRMVSGEITVSDAINTMPPTTITVHNLGSIM